MPNNCGACGSIIMDCFMECKNEKCKKKYDLACLEMNKNAFKTYTQEYKKNWVCPECICARPKKGNGDTPVRIDIPDFKFTTPVSNVNMQRGSKALFSPTTRDSDSVLLEELREFRSDMIARMDSQATAIELLLNQFTQTKTELDNIVKIMKVLEEKVDAKLIQDRQTRELDTVIPNNSPSPSTYTFAEVVCQQSTPTRNVSKNSPPACTKTQKVNKSGATKSKEVLTLKTTCITSSLTSNEPTNEEVEKNDSDWTINRNKKVSRQQREVRVGKNTELMAIRATERKKHLHVWRLHPETTLEAITDHVKKVCGPGVLFKVDKIRHKTERDYSSFIIGVPEHCFDKLNQAEFWPMNAEFNEWIWFRNSTKKTPNE